MRSQEPSTSVVGRQPPALLVAKGSEADLEWRALSCGRYRGGGEELSS